MRNPYATKGRKLHRLIVPKDDRLLKHMADPEALQGKDIIDLEMVQEVLDKISVREGHAFRYHMVKGFRCRDCGDNSFLYISDHAVPDDHTKFTFIDDTWKNINVEPSAMGMWQTYLLMTTIHVMPYWWHGGYYERLFIFSPADLKKIPDYMEFDFSGIDASKLQPEVKFTEWCNEECMGMVSNTYWTEWGGLIRETVFIDMRDNKITNYGPVFNEVLLKYDSLMCY